MLKITGVQKTFNPGTINEKKALCGIDLTLNEGDFVTVIGGNGAGKSTMLNMIAGVYPVDCGSIVIDGKDVTKLPEYKRAKFIGRVFQDPMTGTAADMQIAENLAIAARRGKGRTLRSGVSKKEKVQYAEMLKELDLGLDTRLTSKVGLLSGGQRQAVTLLMATLKKPKVLLLDEPTKGLDAYAKAELAQLLLTLCREGASILVVTHDVEFAARYATGCALMFDGLLLSEGEPHDFFAGNRFYTTDANRIAAEHFPMDITCEEVIASCRSSLSAKEPEPPRG